MSYSEYLAWGQYISDQGAPGMRHMVDRGIATICHLLCGAHGLKVNGDTPAVSDFSFYKKPEPEQVCTDINAVFSLIQGLKNGK